ncbi:MAG TPA: SRPBCC family protein [Steroidobacteraceae bacterium]|nr:SRPBCC family protein [Steroidobacteraceae bacterium]
MNDYGVVTDPTTLRLERLLPGPIERVWSYLTDPEKRGKWLASGPMELRVGGRVEHTFDNSHLTNVHEPTPEKYKQYERVTFIGRVTRFEPPHVLSYTWAESWGSDSEVTFELTPRGDQVFLALTHRRLVDRAAMVNVAGGWHTHLGILADLLNGRDSPGFWSTHAKLEAEYEKRIPSAGHGRAGG